jgi:hypothetical protein
MTPAAYSWSGGGESLLRFGPATAPVVIVAMPPFEEANRTRAFVVTMLRALAERGIAGALPDLPGTGDSRVATEHATLTNWRRAFSSASAALRETHTSVHGVAIRGGALIDAAAALDSRYHFAPMSGAKLIREMVRTRLAAAREDGETFDAASITWPGPPIELAGNRLDRQLIADLSAANPATPAPIRTARLASDAQGADITFDAAPLWRRAEPGNDPALAALIADDIAAWIAACAA